MLRICIRALRYVNTKKNFAGDERRPHSPSIVRAELPRFVRAYEKVWSQSEWRTHVNLKNEVILVNLVHPSRTDWKIFKVYTTTSSAEFAFFTSTFAGKMSTSQSSPASNAGRKTSITVSKNTRKLSCRMDSEVSDAFRLFDKVMTYQYQCFRTISDRIIFILACYRLFYSTINRNLWFLYIKGLFF